MNYWLLLGIVMSSSLMSMEADQAYQGGQPYPPFFPDTFGLNDDWYQQPDDHPNPIIYINGIRYVFNNGCYYPALELDSSYPPYVNSEFSQDTFDDQPCDEIGSDLMALAGQLKSNMVPTLDAITTLQLGIARSLREHKDKDARRGLLRSYLQLAGLDFEQWLSQKSSSQESNVDSGILQSLSVLYRQLLDKPSPLVTNPFSFSSSSPSLEQPLKSIVALQDGQPALFQEPRDKKRRQKSKKQPIDIPLKVSELTFIIKEPDFDQLQQETTAQTELSADYVEPIIAITAPQTKCWSAIIKSLSAHLNFSKRLTVKDKPTQHLYNEIERHKSWLEQTENGRALLTMVDELKKKHHNEQKKGSPVQKTRYTQPVQEVLGRSDILCETVNPSVAESELASSSKKKKKKKKKLKNVSAADQIKQEALTWFKKDDPIAIKNALKLFESLDQKDPEIQRDFLWCRAIEMMTTNPAQYNNFVLLGSLSMQFGGPTDAFKDAQFKHFDQWTEKVIGTLMKQHLNYLELGKKKEAKQLLEKKMKLFGLIGRLYLEGSPQWQERGRKGWKACSKVHNHTSRCYRTAHELVKAAGNNGDIDSCLFLGSTKFGGATVPQRYVYITDIYGHEIENNQQEKLNSIIGSYACEGYFMPIMISIMGALNSPHDVDRENYSRILEQAFPPIRMRSTEITHESMFKKFIENQKFQEWSQKSWAINALYISSKMMYNLLQQPTLNVMSDLMKQYNEFLLLAQQHTELVQMVPSVRAAIGKKALDHAERLKDEERTEQNEKLLTQLLQEAQQTAQQNLSYAAERHNEDGILYYAKYLQEVDHNKGEAQKLRKELIEMQGELELVAMNHFFYACSDKKEAQQCRALYEQRAKVRYESNDHEELERMDHYLSSFKNRNRLLQLKSMTANKKTQSTLVSTVESSDLFDQACNLLNIQECPQNNNSDNGINLSGWVDQAINQNGTIKAAEEGMSVSSTPQESMSSASNAQVEYNSCAQDGHSDTINAKKEDAESINREDLEKAVDLLEQAIDKKRLFAFFESLIIPAEKASSIKKFEAALASIEASSQRKKIRKIKQRKEEYDTMLQALQETQTGDLLLSLLKQYPKENPQAQCMLLYTQMIPKLHELFGQEGMEKEFPEISRQGVTGLSGSKICSLKQKIQADIRKKAILYNQLRAKLNHVTN